MKYILSLDQGTTSSRAIVFDKYGNIKGISQEEFQQIYPHTGWVEHNPNDILGSQLSVFSKALINAGVKAYDIAAIGITNQRETTIVWDKKSGKPIYNAIVWQCRRTSDYCDKLREEGYADLIYDKTGLVLDAYFSATKLKWILDNVKGAREKARRGELLFGNVDTYLMWNISSEEKRIHKTDFTNASRTMLFNIHTLEWDDELLALFDIPRSMLPTVQPSSSLFGYTEESMLGAEIPICGDAGDQQAALFGQLCVEKGSVKNTYGTGCFLLMNTGLEPVKSQHNLVTTLAAGSSLHPQYVLEGSVFVGGAVVQWLRDEMRMIRSAKETEIYASKVKDTNGVYIIPAFVGLGAPYWNSKVRGVVTGITRGTKKEHFVRAALEAIDYQVYDMLRAMEKDVGTKINCLNVDGGASANNFLMQFQSDITDTKVVRPKNIEVTAMGASYLAGLYIGYWKNIEDIKRNVGVDKVFTSKMSEEHRHKLLRGWEESLDMLMYNRVRYDK